MPSARIGAVLGRTISQRPADGSLRFCINTGLFRHPAHIELRPAAVKFGLRFHQGSLFPPRFPGQQLLVHDREVPE